MVQAEATDTNTGSISSWRGLLFRSTFATLVVIVLVTLISREVIPPLLVAFVLLTGGLFWLRRSGRRGPTIFVLVVSLLLLLTSLPFALPAFVHPESAFDFFSHTAMTVALLLAIASAIALLRKRSEPSGTPRRAALAGLALVVLSGVVGAAAAAMTENDAAAAGDLTLGAKSIEWTAEALTAKAGTVGILVTNADATRHDFTIKHDSLKVSDDLPASKKRRVTFEAPAGSYEYICTLHPNMKGTLTVS